MSKRIAIFGGGTGMGRSIAQKLSVQNKVLIGGRTESTLDETAAGTSILCHTVDVSNREQIAAFFAFAKEKLGGPVEIMINAAGINIPNRSMAEMSPEQWDKMISVNLTGAYNCIQAALPDMKAAGDGLIINVSSVAGKRAIALAGIAYSSSKFGMTALGTCVANEVAKDGIRVTNVYPGEVDTPLLKQRPSPVTEEHRNRMLKADHVGELVLSLVNLPRAVHIPEVVVKPLTQEWC